MRGPALALCLASTAAACSPRGTACAGPTCPAPYECVANVCDASQRDPVPLSSVRVAVDPVAFAVLGAAHSRSASVAYLGKAVGGDDALYLAFDDSWKNAGRVLRAFLVLPLDPSAPPPPAGAALEAWTVSSAWRQGAAVSMPHVALPSATAVARAGAPVRFDVTDVVRRLATGPDEGMAILAAHVLGNGVAVATGAAGGIPPRLDVYVEGPGPAGHAAW